MWVRTDEGELWNLKHIYFIAVSPKGEKWQLWTGGTSLALFKTKAHARAALDRLEKWIDTGQTIAPEVAETSTVPINHHVFSFRTLSEDDEFNQEVGE